MLFPTQYRVAYPGAEVLAQHAAHPRESPSPGVPAIASGAENASLDEGHYAEAPPVSLKVEPGKEQNAGQALLIWRGSRGRIRSSTGEPNRGGLGASIRRYTSSGRSSHRGFGTQGRNLA